MKSASLIWLCLGLLLLGSSALWAGDGNTTDPRQQSETSLDNKFTQGRYARQGADNCLRCHDARSEHPGTGIFAGVHGHLGVPDGPMAQAQCETCHGPVGNHARKPPSGQQREPMITFGAASPVPVAKQNSVCLACHSGPQLMGWQASVHAVSDVACTQCHTLHQARDPMKDTLAQVERCGSCHAKVKSDMYKRTSHPMRNGAMSCSGCHDAHQSQNPASLTQIDINDTCYQCHAEKRGPLLWEHEPVTENCTLCHNVHGSVNQAMLVKRQPQLCQECHGTGDHANKVSASMARGGACLNCHALVHGSNNPDGKTFRR